MKIAFLLQDTGAVYGAERATLDVASGLARRGHEVLILLIRESRLGLESSDLELAFQGQGLPVIPVETGSRFSVKLIRRLNRILDDQDVSVLHTVGYKADVHGRFARGHRPQVSTVHGWLFRDDAKEQFYARVNLWALRRCARVVALSSYYEQYLLRHGVARERLVRIPSGVAPLEVDRHGGTFTLGMVGRFSEEKNHAMLLRAVRRVVELGTTVDVVLVGDGPLRPTIEAEIARLDLRHVVKLAGYLSREEFLGRIDALVLCSRIENLPYSVMEAMAAGLPVIATSVGGLPDLVVEGATGYLVASDDDAALADRIVLVAKDVALRRRLGETGREKLRSAFSPDRCVEAHEALYGAVAG
jgi:glycosyltransferase involved in cell wall biosynthesis